MAEISTGKKSFPAMFLSLICPGLGQFYLRKPLKGVVLFFGTMLGLLLLYVNSIPVDKITDLLLVSFKGNSGLRETFNLSFKNPDSKDYESTIFVILRFSDFKTIEEEIEKIPTIKLFKSSVLIPFMSTESYKKTRTFSAIYRFEKREIKFRPIWQFRVSGTCQILIFWLYAIWDGFLGYKGYKIRKPKKEDA